MRILIVDDETNRLRRMIEKDLHDVASGQRRSESEKRHSHIDGIETAQHFLTQEEPPAVIFCTAYEEHALQAFELQAVGYLQRSPRRIDLNRPG